MNYPLCIPYAPITPLSFSLLISSPIRCNLPFSPVSALIMPLAKADLPYAALIVAGLDILMGFLAKRSWVLPPSPQPVGPEMAQVTLTLSQLSQLIWNASNGQGPFSPASLGQGSGPVGGDQPLFPDNLSFSLMVGAPFTALDGSPDTSFNVPLFEIPGVPGNLVIALGMMVIQFFIERSGIGTPVCIGIPFPRGGFS